MAARKVAIGLVADSELLACLLHQRRQRRIMDVTDSGKQMVFDLKIQARRQTRKAIGFRGHNPPSFEPDALPKAFPFGPCLLRGSGNAAFSTQCGSWKTMLNAIPCTNETAT